MTEYKITEEHSENHRRISLSRNCGEIRQNGAARRLHGGTCIIRTAVLRSRHGVFRNAVCRSSDPVGRGRGCLRWYIAHITSIGRAADVYQAGYILPSCKAGHRTAVRVYDLPRLCPLCDNPPKIPSDFFTKCNNYDIIVYDYSFFQSEEGGICFAADAPT